MSRLLPQEPAERLSVLATLAHMYEMEPGGSNLRTALLAEILVQRHRLDLLEAIDLAQHDAFDPRVRAAGTETDRLIDQARRAALDAETDGRVTA